MGEIVRGRFKALKKFEPCSVGDLLIGRMAYGELAGSWVVTRVAVVDDDGAVAMIQDEAGDIAVGRVLENGPNAPYLVVPSELITSDGHEALVGLVAASPEGLKEAFRVHAAVGVR